MSWWASAGALLLSLKGSRRSSEHPLAFCVRPGDQSTERRLTHVKQLRDLCLGFLARINHWSVRKGRWGEHSVMHGELLSRRTIQASAWRRGMSSVVLQSRTIPTRAGMVRAYMVSRLPASGSPHPRGDGNSGRRTQKSAVVACRCKRSSCLGRGRGFSNCLTYGRLRRRMKATPRPNSTSCLIPIV
jgi:hypothetical protein